MAASETSSPTHDHVFLGEDHRRNERRVWLMIAVAGTMMVVEIAAGTLFGSMALVADGWHMATHAGAMLIAALQTVGIILAIAMPIAAVAAAAPFLGVYL